MSLEETVAAAVAHIDQVAKMLAEERQAVRQERETLIEATSTLLDSLDRMADHWNRAERSAGAIARSDGELREVLAEAHRLLDKMPGKRHYDPKSVIK